MIFHFLSLTAAVSAQELGTDCNAVRRFVYPDAAECTGVQFCSSDFACDIKADCDSYTCKSLSNCRDGTTYQAFFPENTGQFNQMNTNSVNGYYCAENALKCGFNDEGRFFIDAVVDDREPWNGYGTPDFRNVAMISKTKYEAHKGRIFKQFSTSSCFGEKIESANTVRFFKDTSDSNCKNEMDFSSVFSGTNGQEWIIDFFIGEFLCSDHQSLILKF